MSGWLSDLVTGAAAGADSLLGSLWGTTVAPALSEQLFGLWSTTRDLANALYVVLVLGAGLLVASHGSLQQRYSIREIAPRIVCGLAASNLSWPLLVEAMGLASALPEAIAGASWSPDGFGAVITNTLDASVVYLVVLALAAVMLLWALVITVVVVTVMLAVLIVAAPLVLITHALPGLDRLALGWWRTTGAVLCIPTAQQSVLAVVDRLMLTPGHFAGAITGVPSWGGIMTALAVLAALYLTCRIPGWMIRAALPRPGGRPSVFARLTRTALVVATIAAAPTTTTTTGRAALARGAGLGLGWTWARMVFTRRGNHAKHTTTTQPSAEDSARDPYHRARTTGDGQYLLPLPGLRRVPRAATTTTPAGDTPGSRGRGAGRGRQLRLPLDQDWPEQRPVLRPDGQYALPITVNRRPRASTNATPPATPGTRATRGRQLRLPLDKGWPEQRPVVRRDGQYALPIAVGRRPRAGTSAPAHTSPPPPSRASRRRGRQLPLPLLWPTAEEKEEEEEDG